MKKIQYKCKYKGLILLLFIFLSVSCSNELDKIPLSNFSNVGFWDSEQNVLLALTGMYRGNQVGGRILDCYFQKWQLIMLTTEEGTVLR